MNDRDKMLYYEVHIEDMLHVLQERMAEFGDGKRAVRIRAGTADGILGNDGHYKNTAFDDIGIDC